ncbi:MAG: hypothetical protein M1816_000437 [Peltula sp. TS41687]|nr:MAG: hypothetical protein M1816_000437 [Peltula sp. TS41687]
MSTEFMQNGSVNNDHISHEAAHTPTVKPTHDISCEGYHHPNYKDFFETVTEAIKGAYPKAGKSRYSAVHVLLLSWKDDDLGVRLEVQRLEHVLWKGYGFSTEHWEIPSKASHIELGRRLLEFLSTYNNEDNLLIVYYGGHGYLNSNRQSIWLWQPNAPTVQWFAHQTMLEEAEADVLILLDCCHSIGSGGDVTKGTKEIIAACGFETQAPGVGHHSFTSSLTEELRCLGKGPTFTAAGLHEKVLNRVMRSWDPGYHAENLNYADENGRLRDKERRKTPIYRSLNRHPRQRSIEIMPLAAKDLNASSIASSSSQEPTSNIKVTISIQFKSGQLDNPGDFAHWLRDIPLLAESVDLISMQQSHSMIVIFALPVAVWDLLPDNPACSFIGFTTSANLLFPMQRAPTAIAEPASVFASNDAVPSKTKHNETPKRIKDVAVATSASPMYYDNPSAPTASKFLILKRKKTSEDLGQGSVTPGAFWSTMPFRPQIPSIFSPFQASLVPASPPSKDYPGLSLSPMTISTDISPALKHKTKLFLAPKINAWSGFRLPESKRVDSWTLVLVRPLVLGPGKDTEIRDNTGATALHWVALKGDEAPARSLLQAGANPNAKDLFSRTPLHEAAIYGREIIIQLLLENGADVNAIDDKSRTPLHHAATEGHEKTVQLLLENGADVNAIDDESRTPLHHAATEGHGKTVQLLLENGADVNAIDDKS